MAIRALAELGADISRQHSKGIPEVPLERIELVIMLCADEVCPTLPARTRSMHWPLPDPAATEGDDQAVLASFVKVRDMLSDRLISFFAEFDTD